MRIFHFSNPNKLKYFAGFFFVLIGFLNLLDSLFHNNPFYIKDLIILFVLSLPLLINKRLFYFAYGFIASIISLLVFIMYILTRNPIKSDISIWFFLLGCVVNCVALISALAFIYIGTYSTEKNRFKLI